MPNNYWAKKLGPPPAPPPAPPQPRYGPDVPPRGMGSDPQSVQRAVNHYVSTLPGQSLSPQVAAPIQKPQPNGSQNLPAENPTNVADVLPIWQWQGRPERRRRRDSQGRVPVLRAIRRTTSLGAAVP